MLATVLIIILCCSCLNFSDGRLLSAYEQAYGPWRIKLTRGMFGKSWYIENPDEGETPQRRSRSRGTNSDLQLLFPPRKKDDDKSIHLTKAVRSIPCILTLEMNGEFTIHIDHGSLKSTPNTINIDNTRNELQSANRTRSESTSTSIYSPLRGEWYLTPNPYCVTDRHYDTLTLIAEPRIRRAQLHDGIITEKARIELRCKLWGRYGVGAVRNKLGFRHGREMGRINHGTVLIVREYVNENSLGDIARKSLNREIIASFTGRGMLSTKNFNSAEKTVGNEEESYASDDAEDSEMDLDELEDELYP